MVLLAKFQQDMQEQTLLSIRAYTNYPKTHQENLLD